MKLNTPEDFIAHYQKLLETHGNSPRALHWNNWNSQSKRFKILSEISDSLHSVLDVGCGLTHFLMYMRWHGFTGQYLGVDIVPEFITIANDVLASDQRATAILGNVTEALPTGMDYAVLSGVFNHRSDDNKGFMQSILRNMYSAAEKGIAFNALSSYTCKKDSDFYYANPMEVFDFCKTELGGHPVLRDDYCFRKNKDPFEFTMYVYKNRS